MDTIKEIAAKDIHLHNMIEDYFTYIKDSNIALVSIQHLLFIKYNIKMDLNDIIDAIKVITLHMQTPKWSLQEKVNEK